MAGTAKSFHFLEATPLLEFIEKNQNRIIGKKITAVRSSCGMNGMTDEAIVLSFGNISIVFYYLFYSDLYIDIVNTIAIDIEQDPSLNFIYREIPDSRNMSF